MERQTSSSSVSGPREAYNYDEFFMQQSLVFSDSLKDLKNLRKQLYSAAEYFELSYSKDDQEQLVMDALKEYAIKALVNTVDHLGSMAFKINNFLDEKVSEVAGYELRVSCIEQRARTCQKFIDFAGLYQQSLTIKPPKHHKRYILPAAESIYASGQTASKFHSCSPCVESDMHQFENVEATISDTPSWSVRNGHSASPLSQTSSSPQSFSFTRIVSYKELEKPRLSPYHFPLIRCGSLVTRSPAPNFSPIRSRSLVSRSHAPSSYNAKWQYPSEPRRAISLGTSAGRERTKEIEQNSSSKSKHLLQALLSMRNSRKDGTLYRYLDEY